MDYPECDKHHLRFCASCLPKESQRNDPAQPEKRAGIVLSPGLQTFMDGLPRVEQETTRPVEMSPTVAELRRKNEKLSQEKEGIQIQLTDAIRKLGTQARNEQMTIAALREARKDAGPKIGAIRNKPNQGKDKAFTQWLRSRPRKRLRIPPERRRPNDKPPRTVVENHGGIVLFLPKVRKDGRVFVRKIRTGKLART